MIKVVFFGTPKIAEKSLEYLCTSDNIEVAGVVTQIDKPSGRGHKLTSPPIRVLAEKLNIPVFQPKSIRKEPDMQAKIKALNPDFFVTFAFGQILSQEVLDIPKYSTINLHASLLPKYRGANPIQRCIYNGDELTGITTMITALELDAGDICLQEEIPIDKSMTDLDLAEIISKKAPKLIENTLTGLVSGDIIPQAQNLSAVTFANKFFKEDGLIDFSKPSKNIVNQIRAMVSWPNAYTYYKTKLLKVLSAEVIEAEDENIPGTVMEVSSNGIVVSTGEHDICIRTVKPEGKGIMASHAWANGSGIRAGDRLGV